MPFLNSDGGYQDRSTEGAPKDVTEGKGELRIDHSAIKGLQEYNPGDEVTLKIVGTLGEPDESGMCDVQIKSIAADQMDPGAKRLRGLMGGGNKPDLRGTALQGGDDQDE